MIIYISYTTYRSKVEIQPIQLVPLHDPQSVTPDRKRVAPDLKRGDDTSSRQSTGHQTLPNRDFTRTRCLRLGKAGRKAQDALFQEAKGVLRAHGLDYNWHFQPAHKGKIAKGHWQQFLAGVMGKRDIDCTCCQQLMMTSWRVQILG